MSIIRYAINSRLRLQFFHGSKVSLRNFGAFKAISQTIFQNNNQTRTFYSFPAALAKVQFNLADIGEGITECELVQWFANQITKGYVDFCEGLLRKAPRLPSSTRFVKFNLIKQLWK